MTPDTPAPPELLRTARHGCWQLKTNTWGQFLAPTDDPLANVVINDDQLKGFELQAGIAPIPADLWSRWIKLCFHFASQRRGNLEVSCRLLRHQDDKSHWRIAVPPQAVGGASVRADSFDGAIDIVTGEVIEQWPPNSWNPCGSSHSHNTMQAFFSGTDDRYELGDPGLHIVVGSINLTARTYTHQASITANGRRFLIDLPLVADLTPTEDTFHPDVLQVVQLEATSPWAGYPQSGSGRFHPNASDGYRQPRSGMRSTTQHNSWHDEDFDGWPWFSQANYPAVNPNSHFGTVLSTAQTEEAIGWLIADAIEAGEEEHLLPALEHLKAHIDRQITELAEVDAQLATP